MKKIILILSAVLLTTSAFTQKMPDLVVVEIEEPQWDDSTRIFITIKNQGKASSEAVMLKVWDVDITPKEAKKLGVKKDDMWIFEENVARAEGKGNDYDTDFEIMKEIPALGKNKTIRIEVNVTHWVYDSNCEIGAFIDCDDTQKEEDENNNTTYFFAGG